MSEQQRDAAEPCPFCGCAKWVWSNRFADSQWQCDTQRFRGGELSQSLRCERDCLRAEAERLRGEKKSDADLFDGLGAMNHRLFMALKTIERASSLDEAKRIAKAAREAEGLLS